MNGLVGKLKLEIHGITAKYRGALDLVEKERKSKLELIQKELQHSNAESTTLRKYILQVAELKEDLKEALHTSAQRARDIKVLRDELSQVTKEHKSLQAKSEENLKNLKQAQSQIAILTETNYRLTHPAEDKKTKAKSSDW